MSPEFVSDGCTGFPDELFGINLLPCCTAHDLAWWLHPGDWIAWLISNLDLGVCFVGAGAWWLAGPAVLVVSTIGAFLFASRSKDAARGRQDN